MTRLVALAVLLWSTPTQPESMCLRYVCAKPVKTIVYEVRR